MTHQSLLTDQLLAAFEGRGRRYDEQNSFFTDDFQDLREVGYLRLAVPGPPLEGGSAATPVQGAC